jgi:hypothetical protein
MTDRFGNEITVGDVVVYSQGICDSSQPQVAVVKEIGESKPRPYSEPTTTLRVFSLNAYGGGPGLTTIRRVDRVIKYDAALLDDEMRALLGV